MKRNLLTHLFLSLLGLLCVDGQCLAQGAQPTKHIVVDVGHGQRFWDDPLTTTGKKPAPVERIKYMTTELAKNASALNATVRYQKDKLTGNALAKCDLLFIHIPSTTYDALEVKAIQEYLNKGGSLFVVMDEDYWTTLALSNVNDILQPFQVSFKTNSPLQHTGGHTSVGAITNKQLSIPYHGARVVEGGKPFCFANQTNEYPFGIYKELPKGGKIVAMGDGMVSLYMTSWEGVTNYECSAFMQAVFGWLLK